MARPRKFDEQTVLNQALQVFWAKGFEATSYDDLVKATGLGRGSLIAAFGDKAGLFGAVLDYYTLQRSQIFQGAEGTTSYRQDLETLCLNWVEMATSNTGQQGCFLALSGVAGDTPQVARNTHIFMLEEGKKVLAGLITKGQEAGEFSPHTDPQRLAAFCVVLMQGVIFTARSGWTREELSAVMAEALKHIVGTP